MTFSEELQRLAKRVPLATMVRAILEYALSAAALDELFAKHRKKQYTRTLLFSGIVFLMYAVVCRTRDSAHEAAQYMKDILGVTVTSVYNKLNGIDLSVSEALVEFSSTRLCPIIEQLGLPEPLLPDYEIRILDGNCIERSQHRLKVVRFVGSGPLPGKALVVLDQRRGIVRRVTLCEDGHAQERSLLVPVLEGMRPGELYIADRNFCTTEFLASMHEHGIAFVIREHKSLPWVPEFTDELKAVQPKWIGDASNGQVFEHDVFVKSPNEKPLKLRRIVVKLTEKTSDGDDEIAILTNVPKEKADGLKIADLYRNRWTIEKLFGTIKRTLNAELPSLGTPKAALFILAIGFMASNLLAVATAALQSAHPKIDVANDISIIRVAKEVKYAYGGLNVLTEELVWLIFASVNPAQMAAFLRLCAQNVSLSMFRKARRGPKKPLPKRSSTKRKPHVATIRLLEAARDTS